MVTWEITPATRLKHELLTAYLTSWSQIVSKASALSYVDGFAGPGVYDGGDPGSARLALAILEKIAQIRPRCRFRCINVEQDPKRFTILHQRVQSKVVEVTNLHGDFHDPQIRAEVLTRCGDDPAFFFIDPFNLSSIPYHSMCEIYQRPKTELLINFMTMEAVRNLHHSPEARERIVAAYGSEEPLEIAGLYDNPQLRIYHLVRAFEARLHPFGYFTWRKAIPKRGDSPRSTLYHLIFATRSLLGLRIMKDIMEADNYRQRKSQLFYAVELERLAEDIWTRFRGRSVLIREILDRFLPSTDFLFREIVAALQQLEQRGLVQASTKITQRVCQKLDFAVRFTLAHGRTP